jgi:hypothetical protein
VSEEEREYLNETIRNLNNQLVDALRERDEARRLVCEMQAAKEQGTPEGWAREWGWDCFEEESK